MERFKGLFSPSNLRSGNYKAVSRRCSEDSNESDTILSQESQIVSLKQTVGFLGACLVIETLALMLAIGYIVFHISIVSGKSSGETYIGRDPNGFVPSGKSFQMNFWNTSQITFDDLLILTE